MIDRGSYETILKIVSDVKLPKMFRVKQLFDEEKLENPIAVTREQLEGSGLREKIKPGMRIGITGGSRGIDNMKDVLREVVRFIKDCGGDPFLFPAMGSHGGAMAQGQITMMESHGFTEEYCECPIISSMDVVELGIAEDGMPVYASKDAYEADGVIAVNRVKLHTSFRAPVESGLLKILTVGMGKQKGAETLHADGFDKLGGHILASAKVVLEKMNILGGVALVENARDKTCLIEFVQTKDMFDREPEILKYSAAKMPCIKAGKTDVLVVGKIGKNFSGAGMDPNITGRSSSNFIKDGFKCQRMAVLDLSEETHGSAMGLGLADVTTQNAYEHMSFEQSYPNALTSLGLIAVSIPMVMPDDEQAIRVAIRTCVNYDKDYPEVIVIRDTMHLDEILMSEAFYERCKNDPQNYQILSEPEPMEFDEQGNLVFCK